ncbi:MAG: sodium-dependent transporter [Lachnospiraceae bacterium]|nr:sodium-dependent transporter [Lachnospiraceae bacterium]
MKERSNFTSKIGFVLAAAGSAVGLGNIWRFPYLAAKYGGGIFLLVYLILAVTFGFAIMLTEIALGRKTGLSAIEAFRRLDKRFAFIGYITSAVPIIIFPYYCVIGGWVTKYLAVYLTGAGKAAAADGFFGEFISRPAEPVVWLSIFVFFTAVVVFLGVEKGIEKVSKLMMPILAVLSVGIAVYGLTLPGALDGVIYYIKPDFSRFSSTTVLAALGQLFYSMSLAMGIMITYGSYMKKEDNLEASVRQIELFDTAIAFIAGLMIIPAVFAFSGGDESALGTGPSLMFVTLPKVFNNMGIGNIIGVLFFVLVLFAALTSAISLMETIVSILQDKLKWNRRVTCLVVMIFAIVVGTPSSLGFGVWSHITFIGMSILDFFDFISNSIIMPVVALLTCLFVGFILKPSVIADEVKLSAPFKAEKFYTVIIKWIVPICIIAILVSSVLGALGYMKI